MNFTFIPVIQASLTNEERKYWVIQLSDVQSNRSDAPNDAMGSSAFELLYKYTAWRNERDIRKLTDESNSYIPP